MKFKNKGGVIVDHNKNISLDTELIIEFIKNSTVSVLTYSGRCGYIFRITQINNKNILFKVDFNENDTNRDIQLYPCRELILKINVVHKNGYDMQLNLNSFSKDTVSYDESLNEINNQQRIYDLSYKSNSFCPGIFLNKYYTYQDSLNKSKNNIFSLLDSHSDNNVFEDFKTLLLNNNKLKYIQLIFMEGFEGSLQIRHILRSNKYNIQTKTKALYQAYCSINHLHFLGFMHGDLNMANVLYVPKEDRTIIIDYERCRYFPSIKNNMDINTWKLKDSSLMGYKHHFFHFMTLVEYLYIQCDVLRLVDCSETNVLTVPELVEKTENIDEEEMSYLDNYYGWLRLIPLECDIKDWANGTLQWREKTLEDFMSALVADTSVYTNIDQIYQIYIETKKNNIKKWDNFLIKKSKIKKKRYTKKNKPGSSKKN